MVKLLVPDTVCQEFRNLVALLCREMVFTRKSDGANSTSQMELMEKAFHGSPGYGSILDEVMLGKGEYGELYTKHELENNREGNDLRTEGNMAELKEILHRHPGKRFIVFERDFVRDVLSKYREVPLKGRNINDRALDVASNYKHALRFYKEYSVANHENPSGMKIEDMVDYVLRKMFVHCKGKKLYTSTKEPFDKKEEDMPPKWMFTGYFSFLMFGPQPLSGKTLTSLTEDGRSNLAKKGRKATRDEELNTKGKEREAGVGEEASTVYKRGVPMQDKASAAHLANSSHQFMLKHYRDMLVVLNTEYSLLLKELSEVNTMRKNFEGDDDIEQETFDWRKDIKNRLDDVRNKKRKLQEEEERLRQEDTKRQVLAYYDQVGDFSVKEATLPRKISPKAVTVNSKMPALDDTSTLTNSTKSFPPTAPPPPQKRSNAMAKIVAGNLSMSLTMEDKMDDSDVEEGDGIICTKNTEARFHSEGDESDVDDDDNELKMARV